MTNRLAIRRTEFLVTDIREATDNERVGTSDGIADELFIRWLNVAQNEIYNQINDLSSEVFTKQATISITQGTEEYPLESDQHLLCDIVSMEYTQEPTATNPYYYPLANRSLQERNSQRGLPAFYIPRGSSFLLDPIPDSTTGQVRVNYKFLLPIIDKRRAQVSAVTLNSGNRTITALTLSALTDLTLTNAKFTRSDFICVVDKDGIIKMKAIPYSAVNTGTGSVTVVSGFSYESGESITVNDYVVLGRYSSSHCQLPHICEDLLIEYGSLRAFHKDSSDDANLQAQLSSSMRDMIMKRFSKPSRDLIPIPITNYDYILGI